VGSFGARLRKEREQRKISLDDISASTKIGTRLLKALEDEHFDQLPGGIFNKGFVRAYARHLGLDEDQAVADYLEASGANLPIPPNAPEKPVLELRPELERKDKDKDRDKDEAGVPWGVLAALLLVVAFGFALWSFYTREKQKAANHPEDQVASAAGSLSDASPGPEPSDNKPHATNENAAAALGAQPAIPSNTTPVPDAANTPAAPSSSAFTVLVRAREDCWLTITADGKKIMQDTLAASAEKSVGAQKEITVRAGSIGALDFFFNGKKLPAQGDLGEVKTLSFDADGLEVTVTTPPPPQP
jgi:cytoskeleton protein RodZ